MRAAVEIGGHTVVLENLVHQALICEPAGGTVAAALAGWERRSRATQTCDDLRVCGPEGWLVSPVEYQGERWGRVAMLPGSATPTTLSAFGPEAVTVLERTAMALTIAGLIHPTPWEHTAHRNVLRDLVEQRHRSPADADARLTALGLPTTGSRYIAVLADVAHDADPAKAKAVLAEELKGKGTQALVGLVGAARLGILLFLRADQPWRPAVERLSRTALDRLPGAVLSVGRETADLLGVARSFREASRVAESTAPDQPLPPGRSFHERSDIGLRRLLFALREDTRIQDYTERQLGRLADHDARHGTDLLTTLQHYLESAGNKTVAARRGNLSRETVYQRLRAIERILDCDLESGEQRTELHVALTALDLLRTPRPGQRPARTGARQANDVRP